MERPALGRLAEELAVRHLRAHGAEILGRNVVVPGGEIDVVARLDGERTLVEVRGRTGTGSVLDAFDDRKARQVARLASSIQPPCRRIDVVAVAIGPRTADLHHVWRAL